MVLPFLLPVAPPGILADGYRGKMGFRPFRPASILRRYRAGGPWRGFAQFPQAFCQSRGSARAGRCCQAFVVPAISASDMPKAGGLAWPARGGEWREHGSSRLRIPLHRREVWRSTSGAAARGVTQQWRCGRLSTRASIMPILSRRARQTYATTLLRNVKRPFSSFQKESSGTLHFTCAISLRAVNRWPGSGQHRHRVVALDWLTRVRRSTHAQQHTAKRVTARERREYEPNTLIQIAAERLPALGPAMGSALAPHRVTPFG